MKRTTYLVTIEHPHGEAGFVIDESDIIESIRLECGIPDDFIVVTETTAVHHAERVVIARALIWDAPGFGEKRTPKLQQAVRELRALMEGKA